MDVVGSFRLHASACADHGSPMYGALLSKVADDVDAGGPVAEVLESYSGADPMADALPLRLMGSVHRMVLERRARDLAAYYPSVGGTWESRGGWEAFRRLVSEQAGDVADWLDRPPQTNEVGRAAALYGALLHLPRDLPVRLMEIGASAGLNLRADRFCYRDQAGTTFGDPASPVLIESAWTSGEPEPWADLSVVERAGCDLRPVDVATTQGRLLLTAYVWADMQIRLDRLRSAFQVARAVPAPVNELGAADFLDRLELEEGTTTVVWHSVMWQYLPAAEQAAVTARLEDLGSSAGDGRRLAHIAVEPLQRDPVPLFEVSLRLWPGDDRAVLGTTVPHGVPTTWH